MLNMAQLLGVLSLCGGARCRTERNLPCAELGVSQLRAHLYEFLGNVLKAECVRDAGS